jgi:hypothetical protein
MDRYEQYDRTSLQLDLGYTLSQAALARGALGLVVGALMPCF